MLDSIGDREGWIQGLKRTQQSGIGRRVWLHGVVDEFARLNRAQEGFDLGVAVIVDRGSFRIVAEEGCLCKFGEVRVMEADPGVVPLRGRMRCECRCECIEGRGARGRVTKVGDDGAALAVGEYREVDVEAASS